MLRSVGVVTTLVVLFLALATGPALASGFPDFDDARETVFWGRVKKTDSPKKTTPRTKGDWLENDGKLSRDPDGSGSATWIVDTKKAMIGDGLVRVRLTPGKKLDGGLIFRAKVGENISEISGYELSWTGTSFRFFRYDRGYALPIGPEEKLKRLKHASLEVVVYLVGPQLVASVYDGEKLERITTLAIHDNVYAGGCIGLRSGPKEEGVTYTLLAGMDAASTAPPKKKIQHGRLYGPKRDRTKTPFGNTRFAYVPATEASGLDKGFKKLVVGKEGKDEILFLDTVGFERLRRTGVTISSFDSNVPWGTLNGRYRARRGAKPTETKRGFRIDQSYKDVEMVEALLRAYNKRYPDFTKVVELGRSHLGKPILALEISDNPGKREDEPSVLLTGGHHASELLSVEYALDAMQQLVEGYGRDRQVTKWVDGMRIFCVPMVNPDGNHLFVHVSRFAGRKNARDSDHDGIHDPLEGVDLNRNYPLGWGKLGSSGRIASKYYRGIGPASEPETAAMMALGDDERFAAAISFHTIGTAIFSPYTAPGTRNPEPDVALAVAMEMVGAAPEQPNKKLYEVRPTGYGVAGSDQDWYRHAYGTLAYIVEGSHHNPAMAIRNQAVELTRPIWRTLLDRVASGPRISGHVRDENGRAIEAEVMVEQIQTRAGERWSSRPTDGRFDRFVIGPGKYTIRATAPGYATVRETVRVRSRPATIDLVLKKKS